MLRLVRAFGLGILAVAYCGLPAAARAADAPPSADKPADARSAAKPPAAAASPAKPPAAPTLSPEMAALRDQVRKTLGTVYQQPFNTRDNNVSDIIHFCRVFGCQSEISGASGEKLNGITCLCWNLPCGGYQPLTLCDGHLAARVGYGYQDVPSQLAAMLALSHVAANYPARVDATSVRTIADLIESEKLACRSGTDLSLPLIALAYYVKEATWKNSLGEEWSIERMVREELKRSAGRFPQASATRLLAIRWALDERAGRKLPLTGDFAAARTYIHQCRDYVLAAQNSDGSWSPAAGDSSPLASTAGVLEWLVLDLSDKRLHDPKIVQSVQYLDGLLGTQQYQWNIPSLGSRDIAAIMTAAHALRAYNARVFAPADPPPAVPAAKPAAAQAENPK